MAIRPTSPTQEELNQIMADYGNDFEAMMRDLWDTPAGKLVQDKYSKDDLVACLLVYDQFAGINPDDHPELWNEESVKDMALEFYHSNVADSNQRVQLALQEIKEYYEAAGEDLGLLNEAADFIAEHADEVGDENGLGVSSNEFKNLLATIKIICPALYLLLYLAYEFGDAVAEVREEAGQKREEVLQEMQNVIDEYAYISTDPEDAAQANVDTKNLDFQMENLKSFAKANDEFDKMIGDLLNSTLELAGELNSKQAAIWRSLIQKWG